MLYRTDKEPFTVWFLCARVLASDTKNRGVLSSEGVFVINVKVLPFFLIVCAGVKISSVLPVDAGDVGGSDGFDVCGSGVCGSDGVSDGGATVLPGESPF